MYVCNLYQVLCSAHHSRFPVTRISLVGAERAKQIETILLRMAQSGQLRGRVTEAQLIDLLDQVRFYKMEAVHSYSHSDLLYAKMEEVQGKSGPKRSTIVVSILTLFQTLMSEKKA